MIERLFGTAHSTFLNNLLGNTQASKIPRTVTREVDPRRLAVWTLDDLYTFLCEWGYEVYDQMDHPALGESPRAMFVQGLTKSSLGTTTRMRFSRSDSFQVNWFPSAMIPSIDEAQHLMVNGETEDLKRCWDWLKSLSNTTGVLFVLAGAYPLLKFRRISSQGDAVEGNSSQT